MGSGRNVPPETLDAALIAPCGMNCGLCRGYVRQKNPCPGCNGKDSGKPAYCVTCKIKTCEHIACGASAFCFECASFPCARLRQLDKRYRTKYGMSMVENLRAIQESGMGAFVAAEKRKWTCPDCGSLLSVHRPECGHCGRTWNPSASGR
jgi:ribosomal protein S27AE